MTPSRLHVACGHVAKKSDSNWYVTPKLARMEVEAAYPVPDAPELTFHYWPPSLRARCGQGSPRL